jgi:hypothetical protein
MIDYYDVPDLYAAMTGRPEAESDEETDKLEEDCISKFGVDFEGLAAIASKLMPLCTQATLPLSGRSARGFAHGGAFICKMYEG